VGAKQTPAPCTTASPSQLCCTESGRQNLTLPENQNEGGTADATASVKYKHVIIKHYRRRLLSVFVFSFADSAPTRIGWTHVIPKPHICIKTHCRILIDRWKSLWVRDNMVQIALGKTLLGTHVGRTLMNIRSIKVRKPTRGLQATRSHRRIAHATSNS